MTAPNGKARRIATTLYDLIECIGGSVGVSVDIMTTHWLVRISTKTDERVRVLSDYYGLSVETVSIRDGQPGEAWWLVGRGVDREQALHFEIAGPHHEEPRSPPPDEASVKSARDAVRDAALECPASSSWASHHPYMVGALCRMVQTASNDLRGALDDLKPRRKNRT